MLGFVGWVLIVGGRLAGAAPTRLVDVVPDVDINLALAAPPAASFDISWVDATTHTYYLADRSNASVDLSDVRSATFIGRIPGFRGVQPAGPGGGGRSGPNGILVIPAPVNQLWAGDGDSTVKVVDLTRGTIVNTISTGGTNRADELAYDATDGIVVIANDAEPTPFFTFISVTNQCQPVRLPYPNTTNGLEQPAWSSTAGLFYVAIPQNRTNPGGEIAVLDPKTQTLATTVGQGGVFPLPCNCIPHGFALGPHPSSGYRWREKYVNLVDMCT
jgi:DNA-binding beta-propeller fold protein YncE